jgi:NAD(P)-dependent dehydrogenase (short-subunit alcohol dehydrogenase family)
MDLGLAGKRALVTGGTKGIGRAISDILADEGADISICARKDTEVKAAVAALAARGVRASGRRKWRAPRCSWPARPRVL